jgi:hypothetical protein
MSVGKFHTHVDTRHFQVTFNLQPTQAKDQSEVVTVATRDLRFNHKSLDHTGTAAYKAVQLLHAENFALHTKIRSEILRLSKFGTPLKKESRIKRSVDC